MKQEIEYSYLVCRIFLLRRKNLLVWPVLTYHFSHQLIEYFSCVQVPRAVRLFKFHFSTCSGGTGSGMLYWCFSPGSSHYTFYLSTAPKGW